MKLLKGLSVSRWKRDRDCVAAQRQYRVPFPLYENEFPIFRLHYLICIISLADKLSHNKKMTSHQELPNMHRALVLTSTTQPPEVKSIPTPQPGPGNAIVRVEAANIISYSKHIYNGTRPYPLPTPLVIGTSAIGRVAAIGPDAILLKVGQLVWIDSYIGGRDDQDSGFLFGVHEGHTEGSVKLMYGEWRDATYAEYAKIPLENCYPLDEEMLRGRYGYGVEDLQDISR
jgi:hypothetical protein